MATELSSVRNGTYLGECFVHCNEEITVSPLEVRYDLTSPVPDARYPDVHAREPLAPERWALIADAAEAPARARLPARQGLGDASDAGGEFLELVRDGEATRVDFDLGADVAEAAALLSLLRNLRGELAARHRR